MLVENENNDKKAVLSELTFITFSSMIFVFLQKIAQSDLFDAVVQLVVFSGMRTSLSSKVL